MFPTQRISSCKPKKYNNLLLDLNDLLRLRKFPRKFRVYFKADWIWMIWIKQLLLFNFGKKSWETIFLKQIEFAIVIMSSMKIQSLTKSEWLRSASRSFATHSLMSPAALFWTSLGTFENLSSDSIAVLKQTARTAAKIQPCKIARD